MEFNTNLEEIQRIHTEKFEDTESNDGEINKGLKTLLKECVDEITTLEESI